MRRTLLLLALPLLAACGAAPAAPPAAPGGDAATSAAPSSVAISTVPSSSTPAAKAALVEMTDAGFKPAEVRVAAGGYVTFINVGKQGHQPTTDPHPAHDGLADFFAATEVVPNSNYTNTFTRTGTFGYHDELHPELTGKVTVVDPDAPSAPSAPSSASGS